MKTGPLLAAACFVGFAALVALHGATHVPAPKVPRERAMTPAAPWVSAYWVAYERELLPAEEVDFEPLTHLVIARIVPHEDGSVHFNKDAPDNESLAKLLVARAHASGKQALLMVGGAGTVRGFEALAKEAHREAFVRKLLAYVDATRADGLDLDWEPFVPASEADGIALLEALHAARPGILLTMPVEWGHPPTEAFLLRAAPLLAQINLMTYGMTGKWPGWVPWHSSALRGNTLFARSSVERSVGILLARGVPREKLGVGVGAYGTGWSAERPLEFSFGTSVVGDDGIYTYRALTTELLPQGTVHRDPVARVPWLELPRPDAHGARYITYEDVDSVREKAAFAREEKLGGMMIWTLGQQHRTHLPKDPLVEAMASQRNIPRPSMP